MTDDQMITRPRLFEPGTPMREKTKFFFNGVDVERIGRCVHLLGQDWTPETADGVGRALIELAEAARAEPDPELLAALTEAVEVSFAKHYGANGPGFLIGELARDVLETFDVKQRGGAR